MATNVQCLSNKRSAIQSLADANKVDILCISEHWLSECNENLYNIHGYRKVSWFSRKRHIHGGVGILVFNDIEAIEIKYIKTNSVGKECELVGVYLPERELVVVCTYRSPNGNIEDFLAIIETTLMQIHSKSKPSTRVVLAGDLNINLNTENTTKDRLLNLTLSYGLKAMFNEPTRMAGQSKTCIDNIFTNLNETTARITDPNYGDHKALILSISYTKSNPQTTCQRQYSTVNKEKFLSLLQQENWNLVTTEQNADKMMDKLMYTFVKYHNDAFPLKV